MGVERRGVLLQSLVMSRLLIGAGSWPPLLDGEASMFQSCLISMYRQVLCIPHGADRQREAPAALWACMQQDEAYCCLVQSTFQWLYERVEGTCPLRSPSVAWDDWQEVMCKRLVCSRAGLSVLVGFRCAYSKSWICMQKRIDVGPF